MGARDRRDHMGARDHRLRSPEHPRDRGGGTAGGDRAAVAAEEPLTPEADRVRSHDTVMNFLNATSEGAIHLVFYPLCFHWHCQ